MVNNESNFSDDGLGVTFLILFIIVHFNPLALESLLNRKHLKGAVCAVVPP